MLALWLTETCLFNLCYALDLFTSFGSRGLRCALVVPCTPSDGFANTPARFAAKFRGTWRRSGLPSYPSVSQHNTSRPMLWHCVCGYGRIPPLQWGSLVCSPLVGSSPGGRGSDWGLRGGTDGKLRLAMEGHRARRGCWSCLVD